MKNLAEAKQQIENGGKFNGQIYTYKDGKNFTILAVFIDNKKISFGSINNSYVEETKQEIYAALFPSIAKNDSTHITLEDFHKYCEGQD